jgi:hypothetical protein
MKVTEPDTTMSKGPSPSSRPSATGGGGRIRAGRADREENHSVAKTRNPVENPSRTAEPAGKVWQTPR